MTRDTPLSAIANHSSPARFPFFRYRPPHAARPAPDDYRLS